MCPTHISVLSSAWMMRCIAAVVASLKYSWLVCVMQCVCVCLSARIDDRLLYFSFHSFWMNHKEDIRLLLLKHLRQYRHTHTTSLWCFVLIVHACAKLVSRTTHQQSWLATLLTLLLARPLLRQAPTHPGLEPFLEPTVPGQWLTCTAPPVRTPAWATTLALLVPSPAPASDTALL